MRLFEYEAKRLFAEAGIPLPQSVLIENAAQCGAAVEQVGLPCMLKAQLLAGGRGKMGLVRRAETAAQAEEIAESFFAGGHGVRQVLVEQAVTFERELYLSITMDPAAGCAVMIGSAEGGVEIEEVARRRPEAIVRESIDLALGLRPFQINDFCYRLGLRGDALRQAAKVSGALWRVFVDTDAELAEINPLFITADGRLLAGDAKLSVDDNALSRQPRFGPRREMFKSDMEFEAATEGIPYIQFDGDISLMCAGAGLANTVYDLVHYAGGTVANYLEFGGPNYGKGMKAMELCLRNRSKVILIVTFGTIARADVMAEGIVEAIGRLGIDRPIVACLRGTGEEKAREILAGVGLACLSDTEEAVQEAIALAKAASSGKETDR